MFFDPTLENRVKGDFASLLTNGKITDDVMYSEIVECNKKELEKRSPFHICIASNKGGVSKSLTAFQLAWFLNARGYKVLLADLDAQANITCSVLEDQNKLEADNGLYEVIMSQAEVDDTISPLVKNFDILGGKDTLSLIDNFLRNKEIEESEDYLDSEEGDSTIYSQLHMLFKKLGQPYDFIIYDTNPETNKINRLSLQVADLTIVPMQAKEAAAKGYQVTGKEMADAFVTINKPIDDINKRIKIFLNLLDNPPAGKREKKIAAMYQMFRDSILNTNLDHCYDLGEASDMGLPAFLHDDVEMKIIQTFISLSDEVVELANELSSTKNGSSRSRRYLFA